MNLLLSSYITADSRIMIRRNIQERVRTIAPFLRLDHDPYLVISDGRLFWMQDAYTTSDYFPYAQPAQDLDLNYIRNSVKVVVDAYNGTVDFYLMDPADPIAATYQRIFPGLFKPFAAMPPDLQKHIRYPEDLFLIQARLYQAYHMEAADVFYNREDLWQFPRQPGGDGTAMMAPYYIIMRLPGEPQAEFFLMLPMVPSRRDNMIAWLAARCDPPDYGKLIVYEFPKEKLVYGPFQIEARINQNTGHLPATHAVEPNGLAGDPRELACDPDRELDSLRIAALFAGGAGTLAGAQARDRRLWRTCGDEGDARRGIVGALHGTRRRAGGSEHCNGDAARRPRGRSGAGGARPLQSSNGALEIRRLGGLRHGVRRDAEAFGGYEPAIGRPLVVRRRRPALVEAGINGSVPISNRAWPTGKSAWLSDRVEP